MIFTKNPVAGKVKTRLAKDLGELKALDVYNFLLKHSHSVTTPLKMKKQVYYSSNIPGLDLWSEGDFEKKLQKPGDLGEKMEAAFRDAFNEDYKKVIIIGSDLYDISTNELEEAFDHLDHHEYVIGPAEDGGYYLLGMKSLNSTLFHNKTWSTCSVFEETRKDMQNAAVKVLATKNDIDMLEDIKDHPAFEKFIKT